MFAGKELPIQSGTLISYNEKGFVNAALGFAGLDQYLLGP
jgi:hypothetical protein